MKLIITLDGRDIIMSKYEAKRLYNDLNEFFGPKTVTRVYPTYPYRGDMWYTNRVYAESKVDASKTEDTAKEQSIGSYKSG